MKKALITGITGQDGSYLAELLLDKGYDVHGIIRRSSSFNTGRIDHIYKYLHLYYGDVTDTLSLQNIIQEVKPDEIYNLSAQSHVAVSFELPEYTGQVDALGVLKLLESVKKYSPNTKIYQASTSELFGKVKEIPQKETTPFHPRSPYGVSKLYAYWICKNYRESYDMFISNGILFNHESSRRGETFVTKKITMGLANWLKTSKPIKLGNLNAKRDWGYAKDYVYGMWLMLQQEKPDDFILATGESHSIREFVEESCKYIGINIEWIDDGINEKGIEKNSGSVIIEIDPKYFRPSEVDLLLGDPTKAKNILGWEAKTKFKDLIKIMMEHDLKQQLNR
jgi:GDPmannose 4,6-dehydratase